VAECIERLTRASVQAIVKSGKLPSMPQRGELLTVGHSNHDEARFIGLLKEAGVQTIVDVRAQPRSRRNPQFNAAALAGSLEAVEIGYETLGRELGGRRTPAEGSSLNAAWDDEAFRGYADHMATEQFEAGLGMLESLARERHAAVMCAEADWTRCHRRLLADALTVRGWRVLHLGPTGSITPHELTDFAVVENGVITYPAQQTSLGI
jgi:uncharacterized protein (DUF488 family)